MRSPGRMIIRVLLLATALPAAAGCVAMPIPLPLLDGGGGALDGWASHETQKGDTDGISGGNDLGTWSDAPPLAPEMGVGDGTCLECPSPDGGDAGPGDAEAGPLADGPPATDGGPTTDLKGD